MKNKSDQARSLIENPNVDRAKNISTQYLNPDIWGQIVGMSKTLYSSGALPQHYKNTSLVVMALQAGYEMGMKPIESLNSLYPVNGTFNIWGKATVKRFRVHGYTIQYKDEDDTKCTAIVTKDDERYEETFTFEMAKKSGYTESYGKIKVGWKEGMNRRRKLRYSALSMIIHTYIPDILDSANEIQEVFEDAYVEILEEEKKEKINEKSNNKNVTVMVENENTEAIEISDLDSFLKKKDDKPKVDNVVNMEHTEDKKEKKTVKKKAKKK